MEKEVHGHEKGGQWTVVHWNTLPNKAFFIKSISSFKRKCKRYGEILKHKSRLCTHRDMQQWGDSYWETYSLVVDMLNVRIIIVITKIHSIHSKAIDFVLAFMQEDLKKDIWMQLPIGFKFDGQTEADSNKQYVLKYYKNLHGIKTGNFNWYKKLKK